MPGPNFNYAVFLGVLCVPSNPMLGAFLGYIGIFTPGIGLKLALLPVYKSWRRYRVVRSVLRGLNAAASGLVYTAVWQLFLGNVDVLSGRVALTANSRLHSPASVRKRNILGRRISHLGPVVGSDRGLRFRRVAISICSAGNGDSCRRVRWDGVVWCPNPIDPVNASSIGF